MKKVCVRVLVCLIIGGAMLTGQGFAGEPLQPMTIQLNWVANVQFAGILFAKEQGWYRAAGIDLNIRNWQSGADEIEEVMAGKAQIGVTEGSFIIRSNAEGKAIRAIATQFQKPPFCLMSKKDRGINTPEQMANKKIGIKSESGELMVKIVLASRGLNLNDIIPVRIGWGLDPFIDDKVDVMQAYMNNEPFILKEKGYDVTYLPAFKYGYDFYSEVYFATEKMIQEHPELVRNFLDVTFRGWQEAFKNTDKTARFVIEKYYPEGSLRQQTESLKIFKMLFTLGEGQKFLGWMEEKYWAKGIDILHRFGQIEKKIPTEDVFTPDFLKAIYFRKK